MISNGRGLDPAFCGTLRALSPLGKPFCDSIPLLVFVGGISLAALEAHCSEDLSI